MEDKFHLGLKALIRDIDGNKIEATYWNEGN